MSKCINHQRRPVHFFISEQCVALVRCKICDDFGFTYGLVPGPFPGSTNVELEEIPKESLEHIKDVVAQVKSYPNHS